MLAPFVTESYNKHRKTADEWQIPDAEGYARSRTEKECYDAFQSLEYEVNTLHTANGQTPFVTFGFGLGTSWESRLIQASILRNRIAGLGKNRKTAVFPKLVFAIRDGLNHKFGDPNYDIKQLALEWREQAHVSGHPQLRSGGQSHRFVQNANGLPQLSRRVGERKRRADPRRA
ncbi:Anaerobic ribonucleoside-triphosphate reductase [Salmonella enterica subsp. enterica]|nr:Anaerobic ribonucleoside-triphosphate reductase [Salmonella enterica subsp. enterica]